MIVSKLLNPGKGVMPLMAALPYSIQVSDACPEAKLVYDAHRQMVIEPEGRDYSTCREDESAGGLFSSKTDTKKDD
jgi:hypothetical protein